MESQPKSYSMKKLKEVYSLPERWRNALICPILEKEDKTLCKTIEGPLLWYIRL